MEKFQSDPERRLAVILEREQSNGSSRARASSNFSTSGAQTIRSTNPTSWPRHDCIYMLEPKAAGDLDDDEVKLKRDVAVKWCGLATDYASATGGKPWKYALIPHDVITDNMTVLGLAERYQRS